MILTAIIVAPMWAQDIPDGAGKDTTVRICTGCHGAEMWAGSHKSSNDWDQTITTMTEKGLSINDADYATVLDYLAKNLGTAPLKVNINKAASADLARVLGITAAQADAIVKYRTDHGAFKTIDDLKKVPELASANLDMKKDRLIF